MAGRVPLRRPFRVAVSVFWASDHARHPPEFRMTLLKQRVENVRCVCVVHLRQSRSFQNRYDRSSVQLFHDVVAEEYLVRQFGRCQRAGSTVMRHFEIEPLRVNIKHIFLTAENHVDFRVRLVPKVDADVLRLKIGAQQCQKGSIDHAREQIWRRWNLRRHLKAC
jgi:hypothetical protein